MFIVPVGTDDVNALQYVCVCDSDLHCIRIPSDRTVECFMSHPCTHTNIVLPLPLRRSLLEVQLPAATVAQINTLSTSLPASMPPLR